MDAHKNFALSTLASPPSSTDGVELTVATGHGSRFPAAPFNATLWPAGVAPTVSNAEIVRVTAKASDTFTVTRAQESSSARTHSANDQIAATITARTLTDVEYGAHGIINPLDPEYGAVGDGVTDDRAAIQAALVAGAASGAPVMLPKGYSFGIGAVLRLRDGNTLMGPGELLCLPSNTQGALRFNDETNGNDRVTLRDLKINGNGANRTGSLNLVQLTAGSGQFSTDIDILNCEIHGEIGTAGSSGLLLLIQRSHRVRVIGNRVYDGERDGINLMYDCQDFIIADNHVYDVGDDGIALNAENGSTTGHSLTRGIIVGNVVGNQTDQGSSISVRGATYVTVTGNTCYRGFAEGIGISNWNTSPAEHITVTGNTVVDAGYNNTGNTGVGINIAAARALSSVNGEASCSYITVANNVIKNARLHGIGISVTDTGFQVSNVVIDGNVVECGTLSTTGRGISCVTGPVLDITVSNNEVSEAQAQGIHFDGSGASAEHTRLDIIGNRVLGSGRSGATTPTAAGIELASPIDANVSHNRCTDTKAVDKTTTYGIRLTSPTGDLVLVGNTCSGNGTGFFNITNPSGLTRTRVADNPGFTPWAGQVSIASGTYSTTTVGGQTYYYKDSSVTYGLAFPTGSTPLVVATNDATGFAVVVRNGTVTGFDLRVWSLRNDEPAVVVQWQAESS